MMRMNAMAVLAVGILILSACGKKNDTQQLQLTPPPPTTNPTTLSVSPIGADIIAGIKNNLDFETLSATAPTVWEVSYTATESRNLQVLIYSSSANSSCSLDNLTTTAQWTPSGGSPTVAQVGNAVLPGDNYAVTAGTQYDFQFQVAPLSGCESATFQFVVITQ